MLKKPPPTKGKKTDPSLDESTRPGSRKERAAPTVEEELLPFDDAALKEATFKDDEEPTRFRGSHPPKPSSSRRLSPTLMKIFKRRREEIGLTIEQVARLAGIEDEEYMRFEATSGVHRLVYDHAVVVARVLGLKPSELPGLRQKEEPTVGSHITEVERALAAGPLITFEGKTGERFGGEVERVLTTPAFAVLIGDDTLGPVLAPRTILGFLPDANPKAGAIVLLRHRKSKLLALRRFSPPSYVGLAAWQPTYVASSGEWLPVGRLSVLLPPH